ncbi:MAG TPA: diguanylate cyclase [Azospirillaceae bacterium]|nr:diguanylate cyclase [Azospirillaceae bacterium]
MTAERPKILAVDDTPANLVALRRLLARVPADVIEATSGNEALALALDHDFAAILLDVNMPEMDGFETAELLRGEEKTQHVPILFVTAAFRDEQHRIKGYSVGAVDYIEKPINDVVLLSKVGVFLDLYRQKRGLHRLLDQLADRNRLLDAEIAERLSAEQALRESEARFRDYAHAASDWFWEMGPDLTFTYLSDSLERTTGLQRESLLGHSLEALFFGGETEAAVSIEHKARLEKHQPFQDLELAIPTAQSEWRYIRFSALPRFSERGSFLGYRGTGSDVTERRRMEERIRHLALFDPLTDLPNRALFQDRLHHYAAMAERKGTATTVLYLDLDGFKAVNDTLGHDAGDDLLRVVASRLRQSLRDTDTVARLGGDEFAVAMEVECRTAFEEAEQVAARILETVAVPIGLSQGAAHVGTSIGIAVFPLCSDDIDTCLRIADMAMYAAKKGGKNRYALAPVLASAEN